MDLRRRDVLELAALATLAGCTYVPRTSPPRAVEKEAEMHTRSLMTLRLSTAPTEDLGEGPRGKRLTFPVVGGSFAGDRLNGVVLPGGADWVIQRPDGILELDLRVTLQTDDGALIHMTFQGMRDDGAPNGPYFRTLPRFETAAERYAFVNRILAVGVGEIRADGPVHVIEELL